MTNDNTDANEAKAEEATSDAASTEAASTGAATADDNTPANSNTDICCQPFDPESWDDKLIQWEEKQFVKDRVRSFFRIPLNYGSVITRNGALITAADAMLDNPVVLMDENSLFGADMYIEVTRQVPETKMVTISGTFLTKVFEGPFKNMGSWIAEMKTYVDNKERELKKLYFYYTTCPKCARKYGNNYVVLFAQIKDLSQNI